MLSMDAAVGHAVGRIKAGAAPADVWNELVQMGATEEMAKQAVDRVLEMQRQAQAAAPPPFAPGPGPDLNVYAPPIASSGGGDWVRQNTGNFGAGLVAGFCCGCFALIYSLVSKNIGSETKRGIQIGFAVQFVLGVIYRLTTGFN